MKKLMKGNEAICEAAIRAGCTAFFGYPITPQNEIPEYMSRKLEQAGGCFIQAESEIAAINMVYGASAAGIRAMTSSSSPGIALKQEGISYLAGANLPAVIVSISRSGPGLGGILPGQADYFQNTRGGGNGDYYTPVYAPNSVQEATDLVQKAFNVADVYRTPVIVLADGLLGQMMEPVEINELPVAKVDKHWATDGRADKRPRNIISSINFQPDELEELNKLRFDVYKKIRENEIMFENGVSEGDEVAIVAYGTSSRVALNAISELKADNISAGLIRPITLWPFPTAPFDNLPSTIKYILVVELSMGQLIEDVKMAVKGAIPVEHYGRCGGAIFEPSEITDKVREMLKGADK